jgi:hypothetical protein
MSNEFRPGHRISWPHAESREEEFVYVLDGEVDAWIDGELHRMRAADLAAFPSGTGICHTFLNNGANEASRPPPPGGITLRANARSAHRRRALAGVDVAELHGRRGVRREVVEAKVPAPVAVLEGDTDARPELLHVCSLVALIKSPRRSDRSRSGRVFSGRVS